MGKVAFVFSGQGDQYPGMGKALVEGYPAAAGVYEMCDRIRPGTSEQCFRGTQEELAQTGNTQPCLFAMELAAATVLMEKGIRPDAVAGFSLGEVVAATVAGYFDPETGFRLVCRRGELMQTEAQKHDTAMAAVVKLTPETVIAVADQILTDAPEIPFDVLREEEPAALANKRFVQQMQVSKPLFCIGVKDIDISENPRERMKKQCVMDILNDVLFSRSSPFRNDLYENGWISSSMSYGFTHCLEFSHNVISGESHDPEAVYEKYAAYIAQMQKDGIDPAAFERCKRVLYANCVSSFDDASEICHNMMDTILDGEDPLEEPQVIASITLEDANRVLRALFCEDRTAMAVIMPIHKNQEDKL